MKLETTLKPRRDGVVTAEFPGARYEFARDEDGRLVADVLSAEHVGVLLNTGNFLPADEADYEAGLAAAKAQLGSVELGDDDDEGGDDFEEEIVNGGLPVEANTAPRRNARKAKA